MSNEEIRNKSLRPEEGIISVNNLFDLAALLEEEFPNIPFRGVVYSKVGFAPSPAMFNDLQGEVSKRDEQLRREPPTAKIVDELNDHKKKIISQMEKESLGHLVQENDKKKIIVFNEGGTVSVVKKD